jgi:hypothetical protein
VHHANSIEAMVFVMAPMKWTASACACEQPRSRSVYLRVCVGFASIFVGLLCSLPAHSQWQLLASDSQGHFFYDAAVQREGEQVNVWRMTDFAQPLTNLEGKEVRSEKLRTTIDCSQAKLAYSQVTRYAGVQASGDVMNHYETPLRFTRIAPGSVDALLMHKVCG